MTRNQDISVLTHTQSHTFENKRAWCDFSLTNHGPLALIFWTSYKINVSIYELFQKFRFRFISFKVRVISEFLSFWQWFLHRCYISRLALALAILSIKGFKSSSPISTSGADRLCVRDATEMPHIPGVPFHCCRRKSKWLQYFSLHFQVQRILILTRAKGQRKKWNFVIYLWLWIHL